MTAALSIVFGSLAVLLCVPVMIVFVEVLVAVLFDQPRRVTDTKRLRLAIVIPAHNEAAAIDGTVKAILPQLQSGDRLVVVADNCSDDTSAIAAAAGAEAIERSDPERRGKGYALDFGIRHLTTDPPHLVIVIDADCHTEVDAIDRLAKACVASARPVQALYLMKGRAGGGLSAQVAEFAWIVKNRVRPLGLYRLGLPCQLMGTGMAFPWQLISRADLASGHIVEDMKLGVDLAIAGRPPGFCPEALVSSTFPLTDEGAQGQRTRWEHGHLGVILSEVPRLLAGSLKSFNFGLLMLALDLSVPPLALLCALVALFWILGAVLYVGAGLLFPLTTMTVATVLLIAAVSPGPGCATAEKPSDCARYCSQWSMRCAKIPMYTKFPLFPADHLGTGPARRGTNRTTSEGGCKA